VNIDEPFSMLVSQTESNKYFGKMMIGRIHSGKANLLDVALSIDQQGNVIQSGKIMKIIRRYSFH